MRRRSKIYADTPLTPKERMFCGEYLIDGVGYRAAIAAGATVHSASMMATRWLKQPNVAARLSRLVELKELRNEITADYVLVTINETIKKAIDDHDIKNIYKGLELLGKHLKLFTDVQEHNHIFQQMGRVMVGGDDIEGEATEIIFNVGEIPDHEKKKIN